MATKILTGATVIVGNGRAPIHNAALVTGEVDAAVRKYDAGRALLPENIEIRFWQGVALANAGRLSEAMPCFRVAWAAGENWHKLAVRLHDVGLLAVDLQPLFDLINQ